jgi:hypothetical protein
MDQNSTSYHSKDFLLQPCGNFSASRGQDADSALRSNYAALLDKNKLDLTEDNKPDHLMGAMMKLGRTAADLTSTQKIWGEGIGHSIANGHG